MPLAGHVSTRSRRFRTSRSRCGPAATLRLTRAPPSPTTWWPTPPNNALAEFNLSAGCRRGNTPPMRVEITETSSLGDRSYVVVDGETAVVIDPQRDIDRVIERVGDLGARITHVLETHLHNDYVTGG